MLRRRSRTCLARVLEHRRRIPYYPAFDTGQAALDAQIVSQFPSFTCSILLYGVVDLNANGPGMDSSSASSECDAKVGYMSMGMAHVAGLVPSAPTDIYCGRGTCTKLLSA
ncbi:hypothetical protein GY45DRAFT_613666 [Cubamyces sp. BRFM 1775]|nr:hypothetical protein GY45DRAFT_613666 [Cubamyces sp. BRFM 1775]